MNNVITTDGAPHRRRTRLACQPCKLRKRKCDGHEPCDSCFRYDYRCFYEDRPRKRMKRGSPPTAGASTRPATASSTVADTKPPEPSKGDTYMEANSGAIFPRVLSLALSPQDAPKVQGFGWNLGIHENPHRSEKSVKWILSREEWTDLLNVYLEKVHPVYGFLDVPEVIAEAARRWENPRATNGYDSVLCGIAALGSLFSSPGLASNMNNSVQERQLVECAKEILETTSTVANPTHWDVEGWVLLTLYLRCNSTPHAAWVSSCTTMHILEAIGLHQESTGEGSLWYSDTATSGPNLNLNLNPARRRRLFWIAKLLNTWISFEYGRSRVLLRSESAEYPGPNNKPGTAIIDENATTDLLTIFQISEVLDPDKPVQQTDLSSSLTRLARLEYTFDAVILSQSVLAFTIYRRLRLSTPSLINNTTLNNQVIALGRKGLEACARSIDESCPWWHVTYLPFQFTCIVLAMDTRDALIHVRGCLHTLRKAAAMFGTVKARRASETAELLVRLSQRRKEADAVLLGQCLDTHQNLNQDQSQMAYGDGGAPRSMQTQTQTQAQTPPQILPIDANGIVDGPPSLNGNIHTGEGLGNLAWFDEALATGQLCWDWDSFMRDPLDFSSMFLRLEG
ncbi:hypothetical protein BJX99DRAFT_264237 [Aspergillus californicus]